MIKTIIAELKSHAPFTAVGAVFGIILMAFTWRLFHDHAYNIFYFLHPSHVLVSSFATVAMYQTYHLKQFKARAEIPQVLLVGLLGSLGIGTLSDCLLPFLGERMLDMHHAHMHIGFIEEWWLVNPLALLGIVLGYYLPTKKTPHATHVFLSTFASLFHIMMAMHGDVAAALYLPLFLILFVSVWIPCCTSDIIFPLLFFKEVPKCSHHH